MRAGADEVQPRDLGIAVVRPEISALEQRGRDRERGALVRAQLALEGARRDPALGHDVAPQVGQPALEGGQQPLRIALADALPVERRMPEVRYRREHVE